MSSERYGDTDLVYWMGRSINAMTREELKEALYDATTIIERQRRRLRGLDLNKAIKEAIHESYKSRFSDDSYIQSFC